MCVRIVAVVLVAGLSVPSCVRPEEPAAMPPSDPPARAAELAREILVVDTHIDVPYRLTERWEDVGQATERGDFDWPRAREGGLDLAFFSIYVPARYQDSGGARRFADELIDGVEELIARHPERFARVTTIDEARAARSRGQVGLALGIENGAAIEGDLAHLAHFHERGVRYVTLTHSRANAICDSSYDENRPWGGLSPFGRRVVREMNRLGLIIDVSHVSDEAFEDVLAESRAPVLATHSSCRRFTPGWERNMSDEMIRRLAANGGVIQINFGSSFLDDDYRRRAEASRDAMRAELARREIEEDSEEGRAFRESWWQDHPLERATVGDVADHIEHVVRLVGIDHVGLGSDFDGVGNSLPEGLRDVSDYPSLFAELLQRGRSDDDLRKLASENTFRVWREVERVAGAMATAEGGGAE